MVGLNYQGEGGGDKAGHLELIDTSQRSYGRLLAKTFVFPAAISDAFDAPILVMLDEFQEIRRLQHFPGTDNLWAALRQALDRPGRVAFVIAGSIVTALRTILRAGTDPLFTRFDELELSAFTPEDTAALAASVWDRSTLSWDQNAIQRLYALSQGHPFYANVLARAVARGVFEATALPGGPPSWRDNHGRLLG